MAGWIVLRGFTSGKTTRRGEHVAPEWGPGDVVAVAPGSVDRLIDARSVSERVRHLRRLRDEGILLTRPGSGRLTHKVRGQGVERAYVFAVEDPLSIPRMRRRADPARGRVGRVFSV